MNRPLVNLRGVPEQEAEGIRDTLREAGIEFYETPAGNWLISAGAIWLKNPADRSRARTALDEFQRQLLEQARRAPAPAGLFEQLRQRPLEMIGIGAAVLFMLWLLAWPVLHLVGQ